MREQINTRILTGEQFLELDLEIKTDIASTYQLAFGGKPWYENTKCRSTKLEKECPGGFSSKKIGEFCQTCNTHVIEPAYPIDDLILNFNQKAIDQKSVFYCETDSNNKILMCAILWTSTPSDLFIRKYLDNPVIRDWLEQNLPKQFIYLDEIFANRDLREKGNLWNIDQLLSETAKKLESNMVIYRTINDELNFKLTKTFGSNLKLFKRNIDIQDRRDLGIITIN